MNMKLSMPCSRKQNLAGILMASIGVHALCAAGAAFAQDAPVAPFPQPFPAPSAAPAQDAGTGGSGEILVTARRHTENVQNVPVSVQVVSGQTIKDLAITRPEDLSKLVAGLTIGSQSIDGSGATITLRGVTWSQGSGTEAIPIYFNDVAFQPGTILQTLYDIGQIEVLRGPQGTDRGAPSISGAVTITSKRPDLESIGGYASGMAGSGDHQSLQGAINVPIIKDKLAIRIAGLFDDSEGNRVHSVTSDADPSIKTRSWRASVLFQLTDRLNISATYQLLSNSGGLYTQVAGTGSPGDAALGIPANFNGPAISPGQLLAVDSLRHQLDATWRHLTINASWDVLGQRLSYTYGLQKTRESDRYTIDLGNMVPGFDVLKTETVRPGGYYNVHEIRLSSIRAPDRFFDYDIGYYRNRSESVEDYGFPEYLAGAFGRPTVAVPGDVTSPLARYTLPVSYTIPTAVRNSSFYGNVQFHLPGAIEFTGGVRAIDDKRPNGITITTGTAFNAYTSSLIPSSFYCPYLPGFPAGTVASPVYTGSPATCDIPVAASTSSLSLAKKYKPVIWNASLSHKFTPDILAYATVGTSWRQGLPALSDPTVPDGLVFPKPEKATSYEFGVKSSFGRSVRLNVDVFQIDYKDQLTNLSGVEYFNSSTGRASTAGDAFFGNVDARVRGIEAELTVRPTRDLMLGANLSYTKIASQGGTIPCNDATKPINAANPIDFCTSPKGQTLNVAAPFSASLNGSYNLPVGPFDGYIRYNVDFQGKNPNFGDAVKVPAYALVDLYAGMTARNDGWELGVYVKNVFDKKTLLSSTPLLNSIYPDFGQTGYNLVEVTPPREVGLQLRYSFGSR